MGVGRGEQDGSIGRYCSPPLMNTSNLQRQVKQFPLKNYCKLAEQLLPTKDKRTMLREVGEAEAVTPKTHPQHGDLQ